MIQIPTDVLIKFAQELMLQDSYFIKDIKEYREGIENEWEALDDIAKTTYVERAKMLVRLFIKEKDKIVVVRQEENKEIKE